MCAEERSYHAPCFNHVWQLLRVEAYSRNANVPCPFKGSVGFHWWGRIGGQVITLFPGGSIQEQSRNQKHRQAHSISVRKPEMAVPFLTNSLLDEACNGLITARVRASIIQIMALSPSFGTAWLEEEVKHE